jgi:hypothetical protein
VRLRCAQFSSSDTHTHTARPAPLGAHKAPALYLS